MKQNRSLSIFDVVLLSSNHAALGHRVGAGESCCCLDIILHRDTVPSMRSPSLARHIVEATSGSTIPFVNLLGCAIPSIKLWSERENGNLESMGSGMLPCEAGGATSHSIDVVFRCEVASRCWSCCSRR
jgi:hypothetical protein